MHLAAIGDRVTTKYIVEKYMTASPHTVGRNQPLSVAHRIMRDHRIRHLPVLDAGKLVGVVSDRDLHLIETLKDVDPDKVKVDEAMSPEPFVVDRRKPLTEVVVEMVERKVGSALVVDEDRVIGVFTVIDALRLLAELLQRGKNRLSEP